jgi:Domain of unknown function (DUF4287)
MSFQAYLDNIKAKTGKTPDDFRALAKKKGLSKTGEVVAWLKSEFALGHGHANAIAHAMLHADDHKIRADDKVAAHFKGNKVGWRKSFDALVAKLAKFGTDFEVAPAVLLLVGSETSRSRPTGSLDLQTQLKADTV